MYRAGQELLNLVDLYLEVYKREKEKKIIIKIKYAKGVLRLINWD